jgi:hypothetical protein
MHAELAQGIAHAEPRTPESTTRTTLAKWGARELLPIVQSLLAKSAFREFSGLLELGEVWPQEAASQRMHLGD